MHRGCRGQQSRWLICVAFAALSIVGCKGSDTEKAAEAGEAASEANAELAKKEADLLARRDALLNARSHINQERAALAQKRSEVIAAGGDTSALDERDAELSKEEQAVAAQETEFHKVFDDYREEQAKLLTQLASDNGAGKTAARESFVAQREKDLARREERLAGREKLLADRERAQAKREAETCGGGAATTIIQTVDAKGSKYTKRDVDPMLKRARGDMLKKGILTSDLPSAVQDLEDEATKAMEKGDFGRAHFAANQLARTVRSIRIDKAFIAAKISRLNQKIRGKKLSGAKQTEVDGLFRQATASYGDGRYSSANRSLNKIYSAIR